MSSAFLGAAASLTCALTWALASVVFARVLTHEPTTPLALSFVKAVVAGPILIAIALPAGLLDAAHDATWLMHLFGTSVLGLVVADAAYLACLQRLGVSRGVLLIPLVPATTAALAFVALGERLAPLAAVGITLTLLGVVVAVYQPGVAGGAGGRGTIAAAAVYVLSQAASNVLQKDVLVDASPLHVAALRLAMGLPLMALVVLATRPGGGIDAVRALARRGVALPVALAAAVGTAGGMWLGATGTQRLPVAVATTLAATTPVWALLIARLRGDAIPARAAVGAVAAVLGVAIIAAARG